MAMCVMGNDKHCLFTASGGSNESRLLQDKVEYLVVCVYICSFANRTFIHTALKHDQHEQSANAFHNSNPSNCCRKTISSIISL
jgi:hypothetical protein